MGIGPPIGHILDAIDPWLVMGAIGYRQPRPVVACGNIGIIPIMALTTAQSGPHGSIVASFARTIAIGCQHFGVFVAPIGQGHVVVDADGSDSRVRPQRIKIVEDITGAIARRVAGIFGPVRAVGDVGIRSKDRTTLPCKIHKSGYKGKTVLVIADTGQANQFARQQKAVNATGNNGQMSHVQDHVAKAVVRRRTSHDPAKRRKIICVHRTEEGGHLLPGKRGRVRFRRVCSHSSPPRMGCLLETAIGVGQTVSVRDVHHDEGIEHHPQTASAQLPDRGHHRIVGRRSAITGPAIRLRNKMRCAVMSGATASLPRLCFGAAEPMGNARSQTTRANTQIIAEPWHHKRHRFQFRADGQQFVQ